MYIVSSENMELYLCMPDVSVVKLTLKMTCSFCSMVSLRKLISESFSFKTVSMSETAESEGDGV